MAVFLSEYCEVSLEDAKAISVACCAAVSYRMEDITVEKAQNIYKKLGVGTNIFMLAHLGTFVLLGKSTKK